MVFSQSNRVAKHGNQAEFSITLSYRLIGTAFLLAFVALIFMASNAAAQDTVTAAADPWTIACVDCPRYFESMTDRSLRLDSSDRPNLAYGGDHLYFAAFVGSAWISETVDSAAGVGAYASLVLSSTNQPHISYYDALTGNLKYATKSGPSWTIETVDSPGDVGRWTSIGLDGAGNPVISYYDVTNRAFKVARRNGTWSSTTVESPGDASSWIGQYTSLAIDSSGNPHVAYIAYDNAAANYIAKYAYWDGTWHTDEAESTPSLLHYASLALDSTDRPHIAYINGLDKTPVYALLNGTWSVGPIETNTGAEYRIAIALVGGEPRMIYGATAGLRYASYASAAGWSFEYVEAGSAVGAFASLDVEPGGTAHVTYAYSSQYNGALRYAVRVGNWSRTTIDMREDAGQFTSVDTDSGGQPHIAYGVLYNSGKTLRYAAYDGAWQMQNADRRTVGTAGTYNSLKLDGGDAPNVGYYGGAFGGPRYTKLSGSTWISQTVDGDTNTTGQYTTLDLAADDTPHMAYSGVSNSNVKYARWTGSLWSSTILALVGCGHTALALDGLDAPHVSYCAQNNLNYAHYVGSGGNCGNSQFRCSPVDGVGMNGDYTSIATDSNNRPHISYYSSSDGSLRYAVLTAGGWMTETVDSGAGAGLGKYTSIALDGAGHPHISYYDANNKTLKYAHWDGSVWTIETVDSTAHVGLYSSITLNTNDGIYIAYYDETNRDLKLATRGVTPPTPSPNLGVTKTAAPMLVSTGAPVAYTITYSNSGQATATNVVITDRVPVSLTDVNYSSSGATLTARIGLTYTWDVSDLAPGVGGMITVTGNMTTASAVAGTTFTNTVIATATGDTTPSNNTAAVAVSVRANYRLFMSLIFGAGGTGTVMLSPPGVDCSSDCTEIYEEGVNSPLNAGRAEHSEPGPR